VPSDPVLVARIRDEIRLRGPMTFARFMELALDDPDHGYYRSPEPRPTREGDFLTAPELHPIFGRLLARQVVEVWDRLGRPRDFAVREFGAGSGALAGALVEGVRRESPALAAVLRYQPVEQNEHRLRELRDRLDATTTAIEDATGPFTGFVLANEFVDALPVHRVLGDPARPDGLAELFVDVDGDGFAERSGGPSTPALAARLRADGVVLREGQRAEVRLRDEEWLRDVAASLVRGVVLVVDYAMPATRLYAPSRPDGTLVAYLRHHVHDDPFRSIGRQDLTAHVDLTALEAAARDTGLDVLGETSQAEFLVGNGLEELVEEIRSDPATDVAAWTGIRSAVARLLDPRQTGGFRVLLLGRDVPADPPLRGLAFRLGG
jgi:SAM-dependent MidA family methyltransferase